MVKGVQKRVVVVRCPETKYFDQAIFMVRDESLTEEGRSPEQVLEEACRAADSYLRQNGEPRGKRRKWLFGCGGLLLGLAAVVLLWLL